MTALPLPLREAKEQAQESEVAWLLCQRIRLIEEDRGTQKEDVKRLLKCNANEGKGNSLVFAMPDWYVEEMKFSGQLRYSLYIETSSAAAQYLQLQYPSKEWKTVALTEWRWKIRFFWGDNFLKNTNFSWQSSRFQVVHSLTLLSRKVLFLYSLMCHPRGNR